MSRIYIGEKGQIELLVDVLENGVEVPDRTGINCIAVFDRKWIVGDTFPFSTFRPAGLRLAFEEFWFILNGRTQTKELEEKGVYFWNGNTTREFLDKRGLYDLEDGDMGNAYGSQLRGYNKATGSNPIDQLVETYNSLKNNKYSRREYITLWNPSESHLMALTPCWHSHQFVVLPNKEGKDVLHLKLINRSLDTLFGMTYAVQQYRVYQMAMAKLLGYELGEMSCDLTHVHIYNNQVEYVKEAITRDMGTQGSVTITKELNSLQDLLDMEWSDIKVEGLEVNNTPFITHRPSMAV